ncbi:MAG: hypothetical protein ACLPXB_03625 [Thiobacillaceae bacterium]
MRLHNLFLALTLALGSCCGIDARASDEPGGDVRAGRGLLAAGHPAQAKAQFEAALSNAEISPGDRFAALMGLGRAELWLGSYRTAHNIFDMAKELAQTDADMKAAETGLAKALNALDYPRQAQAVVLPFAKGTLDASIEVLKAQRALGWQDQSPEYLAAVPAVNPESRLGGDLRQLRDDADYALSRRVEAGFEYQHDSDDLTVSGVSTGISLPDTLDRQFTRFGVDAHTWRADDGIQSSRVSTLDVKCSTRLGDDHNLDLAAGPGETGGWTFYQGRLGWEYRPSDVLGAFASAERAPIITPVALADHILVNTYTLGTSLRPGDHWYLLPSLYHQDFTDANRRDGGVVRLVVSPYDIADTARALGAELYLRTYRSTLPGGGMGYFNPGTFREAQISLIGVQGLSQDWKLRAKAGGGSQTVDGQTSPIYLVDLSLEGRLPANGRMSGSLGRSSVSSLSGGGSNYWDNYFFLSIGFPF